MRNLVEMCGPVWGGVEVWQAQGILLHDMIETGDGYYIGSLDSVRQLAKQQITRYVKLDAFSFHGQPVHIILMLIRPSEETGLRRSRIEEMIGLNQVRCD